MRILSYLLSVMLCIGTAHAQPVSPIPQERLLAYLDQLTQWQRDAVALEPSATNSREGVFRDSLREGVGKTMQSNFSFLRSIAEAEAKLVTVDPESTRMKLQQRAAEIRQRMQGLRGDALRVEQARLDLLNTILANLNSASSKSPNKLSYTIENLAHALPKTTAPTTPVPAKNSATSILSVSADIFSVTRKQRELTAVLNATTALKLESMELMKILRAGLGEPEMAEDEEQGEDAAPVVPMTPDERIAAYKRLGAYVVPLAESMRWMDASKLTVKEWGSVLDQHRTQLLGQLGLYVGMLVVMIGVAIFASDLLRRAIKRVKDSKRQRQLNMVRRLVTYAAIVLILLFNFLSDFSSFATFAGFLTAGLAVALQGVLLSLVAHFLFYGRYGVRNGDRVQVGNVTGDIVQIGMVRFYLRELKPNETGELIATGKVVAFPNAILFQNAAFYKYAG